MRQYHNLPYLNGVINEAMRLRPAIPSGAQAVMRQGGYLIGGTYMPGSVAVRINHCAIMAGTPTFFLPRGWTEGGGG